YHEKQKLGFQDVGFPSNFWRRLGLLIPSSSGRWPFNEGHSWEWEEPGRWPQTSGHCRRRRRPRRGHVVGDDTALYLPGPLGQSKGTGTRSTADSQADPGPPSAKPAEAAPRAVSLAPADQRVATAGWSRARSRGARPRRPGGANGSVSAAPSPRPPDSSHPPRAGDTRRSGVRAGRLWAPGCGQGSWRSGRRRSSRYEPSGRRRLQQQVSIKVLVCSLFPHSRRAQRRLQLFQNTRPVPPTPRLRRVARRGVESPGGRRARGAVAANFPPGPAGRPALGPCADSLPAGPPPPRGGVRGRQAASLVGNGCYRNGVQKQAAAASPRPAAALRWARFSAALPVLVSKKPKHCLIFFIQSVDPWPTFLL
ncbi:hypothetical protein EI555_009186, partial [Monodon monoceros]